MKLMGIDVNGREGMICRVKGGKVKKLEEKGRAEGRKLNKEGEGMKRKRRRGKGRVGGENKTDWKERKGED